MIANMMTQMGNHRITPDEGLLRHMILNSLRMNRMKFKNEFGEMVIACDGRKSWRKEKFPYYKVRRAINKSASELDWSTIFEYLNRIRDELKEYFPYPVLHIEGYEADDIIAALAHTHGQSTSHKFSSLVTPVLILSGDKDFKQLQSYSNVKQYNPVQKNWVTHPYPERYRYELIIRGDSGDDVPNIRSDDDTFVTNKRQKPIMGPKLEKWTDELIAGKDPQEVFTDSLYRNWCRNKEVVDLWEQNEETQKKVIAALEEQTGKGRDKLFNYFIKYKLKSLMESINDF